MATSVEKSCTMLISVDKQWSQAEIKEALEGNDAEAKVLAMKKAVMMLLNGEQLPQLFITIVRYVLPSEDHTVQKLLLLYLVCVSASTVSLVQILCCDLNWASPVFCSAGGHREDGFVGQAAPRDGGSAGACMVHGVGPCYTCHMFEATWGCLGTRRSLSARTSGTTFSTRTSTSGA